MTELTEQRIAEIQARVAGIKRIAEVVGKPHANWTDASMMIDLLAQHAADQAEIKRLREVARWISTDERLPTHEDADSAGCVTVWHERHMWATQAPCSIVRDGLYKHWMPAPRPPEATP